MYDVTYNDQHRCSNPRHNDIPANISKRTIADLADWPYPRNQLVPLTEVVHDRLNVEIFRGCTRGCRFCQAGMITRPVRERPASQVREMISAGLERTGYDEVSLTSLSTADFSGIEDVVADTIDDPGSCGRVSVSLPSLPSRRIHRRRSSAGVKGPPNRAHIRTRSGFMANATNHQQTHYRRRLYEAVRSAYSQGWHRVKLYFLTGLPSEMDDDTLAIADLAENCVQIGLEYTKKASVTVSLGGFVPKPHTPFQWFGQNQPEELRRKVDLLRNRLRKNKTRAPQMALTRSLNSRRHHKQRGSSHRQRH